MRRKVLNAFRNEMEDEVRSEAIYIVQSFAASCLDVHGIKITNEEYSELDDLASHVQIVLPRRVRRTEASDE